MDTNWIPEGDGTLPCIFATYLSLTLFLDILLPRQRHSFSSSELVFLVMRNCFLLFLKILVICESLIMALGGQVSVNFSDFVALL